MKIGAYLCWGFLLLGSFCWAQEDRDPFAPQEPAPKLVIPQRGGVALPGSVRYERLENDRHQYSISGMVPRDAADDPKDFESRCAGLVKLVLPEGAEVAVELKGDALIIRTSQLIPNDTLAFVVDATGGLPFWDELVARDLKRSAQFDPEMYELVEHRGEFPPGLAWMPFFGQMRFHFITQTGAGILLLGPTTTECMCYSRFAIRVLDEHGELLWIAPDLAIGSLNLALGDANNDQVHELYIRAEGHGATKRFVLRQKIKQAAEQPAGN